MRTGFQPGAVGLPENPYPGIDGITTSKASAALPPYLVGFVSGSMILSCSITEPGHPWVTIIGSAFFSFDFTLMYWMSRPSLLVIQFRNEFSRVATFAQA